MRALITHNPVAGQRAFGEEIRQTVTFLEEQGWQIIGVEQTHGPGDATTHARRAVSAGCDAVFVAGGDGTIAQVVDGLVSTDTALGVLPSGSGNVFARQLNLPVPGSFQPFPLLEAARLTLEGQIRRVDVGRVIFTTGKLVRTASEVPVSRASVLPAPRHFLCWSGVGFDAALNQTINQDPARKKRLGAAGFFVAGFLMLRDFAGTSAIVRVDGQRASRRMLMLVASNIQLYGIYFTMAPQASLDDGLLDVLCFQGLHPARALLHFIRLVFRKHLDDPRVDLYRAKRVEIRTHRPLPVHVDGDCIGMTPVTLEIVPRALKLMVPRGAPANLFTEGADIAQPETTWEWMMRRAKDAHWVIRQRSRAS
jgi:YegS/Rv2252/BmrU family lipid kinase